MAHILLDVSMLNFLYEIEIKKSILDREPYKKHLVFICHLLLTEDSLELAIITQKNILKLFIL